MPDDSEISRPLCARVVHLVGAGPGDPELLTLRALRLLQSADVVIHDRLVPAEILALVRDGAKLLDAGKTPYGPSRDQAEINSLVLAQVATGARVVRLKGGDPALFGRLDEEIAALEAAGVAWSVVPGVTAASAAAASAGRSLTRRGRNSSLRLLTGHDVNGFAEQDWRALARADATAAIYMGVKAARFLSGRLLMHGAAAATPVTTVENASRPDERLIATTLIDLPAALADAAPSGPVLILLGISADAAAVRQAVQEAL